VAPHAAVVEVLLELLMIVVAVSLSLASLMAPLIPLNSTSKNDSSR
jgi:hypothetical protein